MCWVRGVGISALAAALLVAALGPQQTAGIAAYPCENMAELSSHTAALNAACCNAVGDDCTAGVPHDCDAECAAELLPFRDACKEVLDSALGSTLRPLVNAAAALCPGYERADSQDTECAALFQVVQNACEQFDRGVPASQPATCSAGCGHAFVSFVDSCGTCDDGSPGCSPPLMALLGNPDTS
eukprot:COSAG06_NODE_25810_length_628_cov_0.969754_1_plen_183_part_01